MRRAGWSRQNTFVDHYLKDVTPHRPLKLKESVEDGPVPELTRISENYLPQDAAKVEMELDRVRKMKSFAKLWESDPLGEGASNVAQMVSEYTKRPLVEVTGASRVKSACLGAPAVSQDSGEDCSLNKDYWGVQSPDRSTVSILDNNLLDSPLALPPGWGDDDDTMLPGCSASLNSSSVNLESSPRKHVTREIPTFTAFRQKIIETPAGKIHKIAIIKKPLEALSKLAAQPIQGFDEIKKPPKMYKKEDRTGSVYFMIFRSTHQVRGLLK